MKIPPGMTEEQVLTTLETVVDRFKRKYKFGSYTEDDIKQEAYILCLAALEKYDGIRPLENFLSVHLRNRLFNFRRNNITKIVEDVQLDDNFDPIASDSSRLVVHIEENIDTEFSVDLRYDWLKMKDGVKLPRVRTERLKKEVKNLINGREWESNDAE